MWLITIGASLSKTGSLALWSAFLSSTAPLLSGSTANSHRLLQNVCQVAVGSTTALERKEENRQKEFGHRRMTQLPLGSLPWKVISINGQGHHGASRGICLMEAIQLHLSPISSHCWKKKKFKVYIDICIFLNRVPLDGIV